MMDEQIVKALRLCADRGCYRCTEYGKAYCRETVASLAWDLIYRQQAEIEDLKADKEALINGQLTIQKMYIEARDKAVMEFAERLKDIYAARDGLQMTIDNLVKEMTEKKGGAE